MIDVAEVRRQLGDIEKSSYYVNLNRLLSTIKKIITTESKIEIETVSKLLSNEPPLLTPENPNIPSINVNNERYKTKVKGCIDSKLSINT